MRPTADRVKEAVFNFIRREWQGSRVLDLFAGSGALGIEALSRGAVEAVFVETDRRCMAILRENIETCGFSDRARVVQTDALCFLATRRGACGFQVIFADPPYEKGLARRCLEGVDSSGWLEPEGRMVVEHSWREDLPERGAHLTLIDQRRYGETRISVYRSSGPSLKTK